MLEKIRQHFASPINKKAASITALALIALAIPLTVFISQQQQELRQRAQEVTTKGGGVALSLTLAPSILEKAPGETFDVELYFDAQIYSITGVDVTINYDPSILQIERFTPVSTFNNVLINKHISDNIKGEYRYAAVDTVNAPQTGRITVGIITFKTQNATGTSYVNLNNTQITALDQSSAIPTANNTQGKYAVAIPTPTPTTAPAPTETPIPATPEPIGSCATLYNRIIKTFGNSCGNASYDKVADLNKNGRISAADYSKFLTYSNNATTCENALNDPTDPCTTPGTTTAPAQPTPTSTPAASPIPTPVAAIIGDANGDGTADILDFNIWRDEFLLTFGKPTTLRADFNKDGRVDLLDFSIWRNVISNPNPTSPLPAPTTLPSSPTPTSSGIGLTITPSSVNVIVGTGGRVKALDLTSTGATSFILFGYPVSDSSNGVVWDTTSGGIVPGQTIPIYIKTSLNTEPKIYTGTGVLKNGTGQQITFPVSVNAVVAESNSVKRVFVTSATYTGALGGLEGADAKCGERANATSLGGTWKAWLSNATLSVSSRFNKFDGPYKLINGQPVASSWSDLTDGSHLNSIYLTELKTNAGEQPVWTNTNGVGSIVSQLETCGSWAQGSPSYQGFARVGMSGRYDFRWADNTTHLCNTPARLYCFEQ